MRVTQCSDFSGLFENFSYNFTLYEVRHMNYNNYKKFVSAETMMGPNSVRILEELLDKYPLQTAPDNHILDLGCGTGLTSLVTAKETDSRVCAADLWVPAEENRKRFIEWGISDRVKPVRMDANELHFEKKQFDAMVSIDSYHYFAGKSGFFQDKVLPFIKDRGTVLIGIPGLKDKYEGHADELLSNWAGDEAYMFKSPKLWKEIIGSHERFETVKTWEMDCFDTAWNEWLISEHKFAKSDSRYFEAIIKLYTCFAGIYIKLK